MDKIKILIISIILEIILFILFRTNKWYFGGIDKFDKAIKMNRPIMLCSWHSRFLFAVYCLKIKKIKNVWAVSSTHKDSQIMAHILERFKIKLIRGSSTRGWDNVIKKMLKIFKNTHSIIAITNDGPKGPPKIAKAGSYKIAVKSNAQIIAISATCSRYWEIDSWDKLRIPKPFGKIYIDFSDPMDDNTSKSLNENDLTDFLNTHLNSLEKTFNENI